MASTYTLFRSLYSTAQAQKAVIAAARALSDKAVAAAKSAGVRATAGDASLEESEARLNLRLEEAVRNQVAKIQRAGLCVKYRSKTLCFTIARKNRESSPSIMVRTPTVVLSHMSNGRLISAVDPQFTTHLCPFNVRPHQSLLLLDASRATRVSLFNRLLPLKTF